MPHHQEALEAKILQNVNTVLATGQRTTLQQISRQADLVEDLQFDSLDLAELSVRLEAEFGVNVFVGKKWRARPSFVHLPAHARIRGVPVFEESPARK